MLCFARVGHLSPHWENGRLGRLGTIVEIRAHLAKWTPFETGGWRIDPAQSGGGVLMDMGAHYLDLFRFLLGEVTTVSYMGSKQVFEWPVEESAFVTVGFESGAHGVLGLSFAVPFNGNVLEVYGTKGSLFLGKDLQVHTENGVETSAVSFPDYYLGLLTNFHDCVDGTADPIASGFDGLKNIQIIEAAYQSGREQRLVSCR